MCEDMSERCWMQGWQPPSLCVDAIGVMTEESQRQGQAGLGDVRWKIWQVKIFRKEEGKKRNSGAGRIIRGRVAQRPTDRVAEVPSLPLLATALPPATSLDPAYYTIPVTSCFESATKVGGTIIYTSNHHSLIRPFSPFFFSFFPGSLRRPF